MTRGVKRTKSVPLELLPLELRQEWQSAFADPDIIDEWTGKPVQILSDAHQENVLEAVLQFIKFQMTCGVPLTTSLRDRLTDTVAITTYYELKREDEEENSRSQRGKLRTSLDYAERLQSARLRCLGGKRDWLFDEWMRDIRNECSMRAKILAAPIDLMRLRQIALDRMDALIPVIASGRAHERHYIEYQTAHAIAFLVHVPVRVRSFCSMQTTDITLRNETYTFGVPILKNRKWEALNYRMPREMTPYWRFFIDAVRPYFNVGDLNSVWLYDDGSPLPGHILAYRFTSLIRTAAGVHMSPHRVRHAAAAHAQSIGMSVAEIAAVLQEKNSTTVERHYKPPETVIIDDVYHFIRRSLSGGG
jgi:integrase